MTTEILMRTCPCCNKTYEPDLGAQELALAKAGHIGSKPIEQDYPGSTKIQREQLLSGVCSDKCWNSMFRRFRE